jgi:hypothetical protein
MKIDILGVQGRGNPETEEIWFMVKEDTNAKFYMVADTTYKNGTEISNKLRHTYKFPDQKLDKGDSICLHTKKGMYHTQPNKNKKTLHHFYWGLDEDIWNKTGDIAYLYFITDSIREKIENVNYNY